jgi:ketosteroid isomerase-like protein
MPRFSIVFTFALLSLGGCTESRRPTHVDVTPDMEHVVTALAGAYAAFNRGDMTAAVEPLDAQVEWTEPAEFPRGGKHHGRDGVKQYLTQSRAAWGEVNSEAERFIIVGKRIVVFVHARVRDKWPDVSLADVYTVRNGRVVEMQAFADRQEALRWAGAGAERDR